MKLWITGARGFVGRHTVALAHASRRHSIVGLGHGAWPEHEYHGSGLVDWLNGEISYANLDALRSKHGVPDGVIHLAGGSAVGPSFAAPAEDFRRSVCAVVELLDWVRQHAPAAGVCMASSAAVYGAGHAGPIAESVPCTPFSPYGFHKRMAELAMESYGHNFGLRVAVVRLFSVYGPGIRKQLLWDVCTRLSLGQGQLTLGGTGHELRDWLHVRDAAALLLHGLAIAHSGCPTLNGGTGIAASVRDVAGHLAAQWGGVESPRFSGVSRSGDPERLVADIREGDRSGWRADVAWRDGLSEYVAWFKAQAGSGA